MIHTNIVRKPLTAKELMYTPDSFALNIPLDCIDITHPTLNSKVAEVNLETLEITGDESYKKESLKINKLDDQGEVICVTNFKIVKHCVGIKQNSKSELLYIPCLSVGLNSKFIGKDYFLGITTNHIIPIYREIMSLNIFKCAFKDFINGYVSDYDIKKDEYIEKKTYIKTIKVLNNMFPLTKGTDTGATIFTKQNNLGLQFNKREKSVARMPFCKTYFKEIELTHHSTDFYNHCLSDRDIDNLARFEYGVKNKTIANHYNIRIKTLKDLLNTSQEEFKRIHQEFIAQNFKNAVMKIKTTDKKTKELGPLDEALLFFIEYCLDNGETIDLIIFNLLKRYDDKNTRYKMKSKISAIYNENIKGIKTYKNSEDMSSALSFLSGGNEGFFNENFDNETE